MFEANHINKLKKNVIGKLLRSDRFIIFIICFFVWITTILFFQFSAYPWVSFVILFIAIYFFVTNQFKIIPVSKIIEDIYNEIFFSGKTLNDLPNTPVMAINSTNLETGRQFTFSKHRMGDSTYDYPPTGAPIKFSTDHFPIARAVMASSSVPFLFTPVKIDRKFYINKNDVASARPELVDGGVFDNQGLHKLNHGKSGYECNYIIVSDAGNKMLPQSNFKNGHTLLMRCMNLFMNRIKKFEMTDNLYNNVILKKKQIAYISLGWELENCISGFIDNLQVNQILPDVIAAHNITPNMLNPFDRLKIETHLKSITGYDSLFKQKDNKTEIARQVGTNLTSLSNEKIHALINHSELMTELQIRLYCPGLYP
ncbi:MAG: patatin-like phospholipase family protein [Saprospiraceae bacterium]